LATFSQRIRGRLPIAPYNPTQAPAAPTSGRYSRPPLVTLIDQNTQPSRLPRALAEPRAGALAWPWGGSIPTHPSTAVLATMSAATAVGSREYELVLMLDPEIPEQRRDQIASDTRKRIESAGDLKHDTGWGMRKLAYEIRQRTEADYRFFRFETGEELLDELNHNLRIADGVLRFRIFKVDPRSPAIIPPAPMATPGGGPPRGARRPPAPSGREAPAQEDAEPAPAQEDAEKPSVEEDAETPSAEEGAQPPAEDAPAVDEEAVEPAERDSEPEATE